MPEGKAATVTVWTNDAATAYSYDLSSLVFDDEAKAPVLHFDHLDGDSVELRVSREAGDDVRIEYKLALREWEKPVFRFAETSL